METVIFSYKIDDILEEITKRTSYLGKMRSSQTEPFLVDRLSLTSGENFMFTEFLQDSVAQVYDWLKAFGRKIKYSNKCDITYQDIQVYKDNGVVFTLDGDNKELGKWTSVRSWGHTDMEDGHVSYGCEDIVIESTNIDVRVTADFRYTIYSLLDGLECKTVVADTKLYKLTINASKTINRDSFAFECNENGDYRNISRVDMQVMIKALPADVKPITRGMYVECCTDFNDDAIFDVYQVVDDCTNEDWDKHADKLEYDPRESIVFMLEKTDYFDENMISSVSRNIKEALVNYIIFRWFEFVNEVEAEKFYYKFEDYAYKAKQGMESETKPIQRRYKLF